MLIGLSRFGDKLTAVNNQVNKGQKWQSGWKRGVVREPRLAPSPGGPRRAVLSPVRSGWRGSSVAAACPVPSPPSRVPSGWPGPRPSPWSPSPGCSGSAETTKRVLGVGCGSRRPPPPRRSQSRGFPTSPRSCAAPTASSSGPIRASALPRRSWAGARWRSWRSSIPAPAHSHYDQLGRAGCLVARRLPA